MLPARSNWIISRHNNLTELTEKRRWSFESSPSSPTDVDDRGFRSLPKSFLACRAFSIVSDRPRFPGTKLWMRQPSFILRLIFQLAHASRQSIITAVIDYLEAWRCSALSPVVQLEGQTCQRGTDWLWCVRGARFLSRESFIIQRFLIGR